MPPWGILYDHFVQFLCNFFTDPIFDLVTANDKYKDSLKKKSPRFTPLGFRTEFGESIEKLLNHRSDFRSCDEVG